MDKDLNFKEKFDHLDEVLHSLKDDIEKLESTDKFKSNGLEAIDNFIKPEMYRLYCHLRNFNKI